MYISEIFSERKHRIPLFEDVRLFENARAQGIFGKVCSNLRSRALWMRHAEKRSQEVSFIGHNPLNTRMISFQGFGGGHYLLRTR